VRANCIAPANIATDINAAFDKAAVTRLQPLSRVGLPLDVADAVVYLASDRAAQVTGVVLPVDGGMSTGTPPGRVAAVAAANDQ
jgi:NAD(P)-dependent dehydrogenase (short-subunit alcohol dehydrogenase family)